VDISRNRVGLLLVKGCSSSACIHWLGKAVQCAEVWQGSRTHEYHYDKRRIQAEILGHGRRNGGGTGQRGATVRRDSRSHTRERRGLTRCFSSRSNDWSQPTSILDRVACGERLYRDTPFFQLVLITTFPCFENLVRSPIINLLRIVDAAGHSNYGDLRPYFMTTILRAAQPQVVVLTVKYARVYAGQNTRFAVFHSVEHAQSQLP
jgi:hypothetical protein